MGKFLSLFFPISALRPKAVFGNSKAGLSKCAKVEIIKSIENKDLVDLPLYKVKRASLNPKGQKIKNAPVTDLSCYSCV